MSFRVSELRNLNQQFLSNANFYLNEARNKLKNHKDITSKFPDKNYNKISIEQDNESYDMSQNINYYSKAPYRHQYTNWKNRNDSQQLSSNFSWNTINTNKTGTRPINNTNKINSRINSVKKIKRLLVSDKTYDKNETKSYPPNASSVPCKNCYCQNSTDLIKRHCSCTHSENKIYYDSDIFSDESSQDTDERCSSSGGDYDDKHSVKILQAMDVDELESLKHFRDKNYFECHSVETKLNREKHARISPHTCKHDFVINERLFAEPVYSDHKKNSRCRECHLPLDINEDKDVKKNKKHICKFFNNDRLSDSDSSSSSDDSDIEQMHKTERNVPEVNIRFPYRKELIIDQSIKPNLNVRSKPCTSKTSTKFQIPTKSLPIQDSLALRYQPGFKHLSSDNSI